MIIKKRTNGSESVESYAVCICPSSMCTCSCFCTCECHENNTVSDGSMNRDSSNSAENSRTYNFNMSSESRR